MEADKLQGLPDELMTKSRQWRSSPKATGLYLGQDSVEFESGGYEKLNPCSKSGRRAMLLGNVTRDNNSIWLGKTLEISMVKCFRNTACKWQCCHKTSVGYKNLRFPSRKYVFAKARPVVFLLTIDQWPATSQCFSSLSSASLQLYFLCLPCSSGI